MIFLQLWVKIKGQFDLFHAHYNIIDGQVEKGIVIAGYSVLNP